MHISRGGVPLLAWTILVGFVSSCPSAQPLSAQPPNGQNQARDIEAEILLGAARNAIRRGELDTAIQRLQDFLEQYPDRDDGRRAYADVLFQIGRPSEAMPEYERLLKSHPDDPQVVRALVDALLNIGDHPRAKARLVEAMGRFPDRVDFAISLALLQALDEDTAEAKELVRRAIKGRPLANDRMCFDAASLYVQLRDADLAGPVVAELLKRKPNDAKALAISVRYALLIGDHDLAVRQAAKLDQLYPGNIDLRLELASALYAAHRYTEAGRLFGDVLRKAPKNEIALLGSARVALRDYRVDRADAFLEEVPADIRGRQWHLATVERDTIAGNYLRAYRILDRLLQENPDDNRASMAMADLDRAENDFIKADTRYRAEGATANNAAAAQHLAVSLYLQCRYAETECACRRVLDLDPADAKTMIVLARVLVKTNRCEEAASLIRRAREADKGPSPEGLYFAHFIPPEFGLYEAKEEIAHEAAAAPLHVAVTLFDLAMEDGRREWAKTVLDEALKLDPKNTILQTRLAEWHASFGLPSQARCAARIYEELLAQEPSNQKWILGLARATATMRCYQRSLALYRRLRCESPDNYPVARETAEVVFHVCGTPKGLAEYDSALCGWPGLDEEANRLSKERLAKSTHFSSPSIAVGAYGELLSCEPYEQHIAFELGQVHGIMGTTRDAIDAYEHLLSVDPNHRDARVAIEGKWLALRPEVFVDHRFVRERGRDGLTSIDRLGEFVGYKMPFADQNEWFSVGYGRLSLAPTAGNATTGDALTFTLQKQVDADFGPRFSPYAPLAVFLDAEVQRYDRYVATRPVFEAGIKVRTCDDLLWTISGTMQNVLENSESLQQDIYRGGLRTDLKFMPNNYWESEATYELQGYSDNNLRQAFEFRNRLQLTPDPRRFSLLADFYYWNFAYPSEFSPGADPFLNMTHPYWTPMNYAMPGVGIEWKQWLSWDRFDGADHCWVSFSLMKRWDSQNQNYTVYRGMLGWDLTRRLSGYATGEYTDGAPYRGTGAYGGLAWKF